MNKRKKENLEKRNLAIKEKYKLLRDVREHNVQKHTHGWICAELATKFFLDPTTIERIVRNSA